MSQRIAWYYCSKHLQETIDSLEHNYKREKLAECLRKSISKIIADWFADKSNQNDQKNIIFSFSRFDSKQLVKPILYHEFGLKNKRRIMEDKTAIYENISLFTNDLPLNRTKRSNALFAVFDG